MHFLFLQLKSRSTILQKLHCRVGELRVPSKFCEMCVTKACAEPTSPGVWWRDDAEWKQYDAAISGAIQQGLADRANRVELGNLVSSKYARGAQYVVDLSCMKQVNVATGFTRDVKVVKAPIAEVPTLPVNASDALSRIKEEVRACEESTRSLKKMVMKLEADFLAVELQILKIKANLVPAKVTCPDHVVSVLHPKPDDHWESCDSAGDYYPDSQSDDDY